MNLRYSYADICQRVLREGRLIAPRGVETLELDDVMIVMEQPHRCLPTDTGRNLHLAIAAAEALQLISGESRPELMTRVAPTFKQFMEARGNSLYQHGAYGRRIYSSIPKLIELLKRDPNTRQAVLNIWQADLDLGVQTPDVPCTLNIRFAIRDGLLDMSVVMRSNDVWWGLPYDTFQFAALQATIARCLGVVVGTYTHHAMSLHAYVRDADGIEGLHTPQQQHKVVPEHGVGRHISAPWWHYAERATHLLDGGGGYLTEHLTPSEEWMVARLKPYVKEEG
jgi:thymidylate synthase